MNKISYIFAGTLLICAISLFLYFYPFNTESINESDEKIKIVVTIVPQAEYVEKIGRERVSVTVLVPPSASPHTYEPTPSQMKEVAMADMFAKVGSGIEFELAWMNKLVSINPSMLIIDCSEGIHLIDMVEAHEKTDHKDEGIGKDPHIWLSPRNAIIMVDNICNGLVELDPEYEFYYRSNRDQYVKVLEDVDDEFMRTLSVLRVRKFMVYHPSWGYFAHEYDLEMIPIEEEGKALTPEGISYLIKQAKENEIKVIFANPEFETVTAETIAKEIGGKVILISPLEKDYINMLKKISEEIQKSS